MEIIKSMLKHYYSLLLLLAFFSFVIWMFFSEGLHGKENVFWATGEVVAPLLHGGEMKSDGIAYMENNVSGYVPVITYTGGIQEVGKYISIKSLLDVTLEDGTTVNGSVEDGFTIYLEDIKNSAGNSTLMYLTAEDIANMEEIPASFVYEKEEDILHCFASGIYTVYLKIYGSNGGVESYVFQMPVEPS